jgi:hypothetical protein
MTPRRISQCCVIPVVFLAGMTAAHATDESVASPRWLVSGSTVTEPAAPSVTTQTDFSSLLTPELRRWGGGNFSIPLTTEERRLDNDRSLYSRALSIQWEHRADAGNRYTLTARREYARTSDFDPATASGLAASMAWRHSLNPDTRFTSRLLLGDEENRAAQSGLWTRRYYGLELEGRYQLWAQHAPFASFSWQRSGYDSPDSLTVLNGRRENRSHFAAGWEYQPLPNWGFRAEANLRLNEDALDPADDYRSRLYFSTQYGFR